MNRISEERPRISREPYLTRRGQDNANAVCKNLDTAINELESARVYLSKIKGMGTELYIERLNELISNYRNVKRVIRGLRMK